MKKFSVYQATDKMSDLINDNSHLLMAMSRFGISLGFGDKTVQAICQEQQVDCATFLTVANFISQKEVSDDTLSVETLIQYLKRAHSYFLNFNLPAIRRKLIEAIDCSGSDDISFLILKFYDEYVTEVRAHMQYEDQSVFVYVEGLLQGKLNPNYSISQFADKHNHIAPRLKELKDIIIRYYPQKENDLLNAVLFDIINCELDLTMHCQVEECLFVPAVTQLETNLVSEMQLKDEENTEKNEKNDPSDALSQREKEIVSLVAKGMTNKEIAEALFLSVHTVTTHRRNISSKLQIHTSAGLTIYAIVNDLVKIKDIKEVINNQELKS